KPELFAGESPWGIRASLEKGETVFRPISSDQPLGHYPFPLNPEKPHPSLPVWAGGVGSHVHLVKLDKVRPEPRILGELIWKKEVLQASEPVLVTFLAPRCPTCRAMEPVIETLARDFKVCKVNVDTNQELAAHYSISSIPALLIFKGGKIAARHVGVTPEA